MPVSLNAQSNAQSNAQMLTVDNIQAYFSRANIISGPTIVDCTLSGGSKSSCFQITVKAGPSSHDFGPWCPESVSDSAESGGIWLENGEVNDVDGAFIQNLATFYSDSNWQLYNPETGEINVTNTFEKCDGAAKPDVEPEYQQHCVECLNDYLNDDASITYTIPLSPIRTASTSRTNTSGAGVAFNGIRLDGSAPVDAILGNYTLAPFDDCGGHINLNVGYHYHAATDCLTDTSVDTNEGNAIGLAMDGYWILARRLSDGSIPDNLDQCGGHTTEALGYHYHAGDPGSNAILGCLTAETGCVSSKPGQVCDASASSRGPGGGGNRPDFSSAAIKLGVSENVLIQALGRPPLDLEKAAEQLGVTASELQQALAGE